MILTRDQLKELYATGSLEVVLCKPPVKETQSVQLRVAAPAVCIVTLVDTWPHRSGGHVCLLDLVKRLDPGPPRVREVRDVVRLMKRGHGETTDPNSAWRDRTMATEEHNRDLGPPPESEQVDEITERRFAHDAHRSHELRLLERQRRELTERLDRTLEGAERLGVDPTRHLAAIERRIADLEKKLKKAA